MKYLQKKKQGFTLLEILVVVTIIAIILGLSAATMKGLTRSKGVSAGIPVMKSAMEEARQLAIGTGDVVRVFVHVDGTKASSSQDDRNRFGRFVGVAEDVSGTWTMTGTGSYLPEGCFFDVDKSDSLTGNVDINGVSVVCHYYEFNSFGYAVGSESDTGLNGQAPRVVLSGGKLVRSGGGIEIATPQSSGGDNSRNYRGFVIGRHGEVVDLTNLDEI